MSEIDLNPNPMFNNAEVKGVAGSWIESRFNRLIERGMASESDRKNEVERDWGLLKNNPNPPGVLYSYAGQRVEELVRISIPRRKRTAASQGISEAHDPELLKLGEELGIVTKGREAIKPYLPPDYFKKKPTP